MKEVILIKNGELALKGLNRRTFEDMLMANIRRRLASLGKFTCTPAQSTIIVEGPEDADLDEATERLLKVFGIAGLSRAAAVEKDMDVILNTCVEYTAPLLNAASTFKVEAKRADKKFPLNSPAICREVGGKILSKFHHLKVDVHNPDVIINVEVRDKCAFIHGNQLKGAGGMPSGSAGKAALLVSGGIDSPVAGWMMAKRGVELIAIHFASPWKSATPSRVATNILCRESCIIWLTAFEQKPFSTTKLYISLLFGSNTETPLPNVPIHSLSSLSLKIPCIFVSGS